MSCNTTLLEVLKDCNGSAGLKKFYIAPKSGLLAYTADTNTWQITGATMSGTPFVEYQFVRGNAFYEENPTPNDANGSTYVEQNINVKLNKRQGSTSKALNLLFGQDLMVIVHDNNDVLWAFGFVDGEEVRLAPSTGGSGAARGDANQYTMVFNAQANNFAYTFASSLIAGIVA